MNRPVQSVPWVETRERRVVVSNDIELALSCQFVLENKNLCKETVTHQIQTYLGNELVEFHYSCEEHKDD